MPTSEQVPTPRTPHVAVLRLLLFESAQSRRGDARYLADEVEARRQELERTGALTQGSPANEEMRMLAAQLRQSAVYERLDREVRAIALSVCDCLALWELRPLIEG